MRSTVRTEKPGATRRSFFVAPGVGASVPAAMSRTRPALVAHGVVVRVGVRVEPRRVAALAGQAHRAGEARARERVERVVHRREAHRREARAESLEQVLRRGVRRVAGEEAHDRDPLGRELQPGALEIAQHGARELPVVRVPFHADEA